MVEIGTSSGASGSRRLSHHIRRKPASNLIHAVRIADGRNLRLNQFVTFNFTKTACPTDLVSIQFEKLRDTYFVPWLRRADKRRPTKPPAYVWAIENPGGCLNVHWLVHIPEGRVGDFRKRLPLWLAAVAGEVHCTSAIHVRFAPRPIGAGKYMLKGMDAAFAPFFKIDHIPQGIVHGKRSGFSRSLGPTVRRRMEEAGELLVRRRFRRWPTASTVVPPGAQ